MGDFEELHIDQRTVRKGENQSSVGVWSQEPGREVFPGASGQLCQMLWKCQIRGELENVHRLVTGRSRLILVTKFH